MAVSDPGVGLQHLDGHLVGPVEDPEVLLEDSERKKSRRSARRSPRASRPHELLDPGFARRRNAPQGKDRSNGCPGGPVDRPLVFA